MFRVETHENVPIKGRMRKDVTFRGAGAASFLDKLQNDKAHVCRVRHLENGDLEVVKRFIRNKGLKYKLGFDSEEFFERVLINVKDQTVAVDRMDKNWFVTGPFLGRRDLFCFLPGEERMQFFRHIFWIPKVQKFWELYKFPFAKSRYNRAFAKDAH